jgi:hypothetical protein
VWGGCMAGRVRGGWMAGWVGGWLAGWLGGCRGGRACRGRLQMLALQLYLRLPSLATFTDEMHFGQCSVGWAVK